MFNQNPYMYNGTGFDAGLTKKKFNWEGLLNNTQKTLNVINQALPIYHQVKPIFGNAKTMFKVLGEINKIGKKENTISQETKRENTNNPQFFV